MKTKEIKRAEAQERTELYRSMSLTERLMMVRRRPGQSKKEWDRLMKSKAAENRTANDKE